MPPKPITQEEAEQRCLDAGFLMVGFYINSKTKTWFECPFCGEMFECIPERIWGKKTKSCGRCDYSKQARAEGCWKGGKFIPGDFMGNVRRRAKAFNREFSITIPQLETVYSQQDGECNLTGRPIGWTKKGQALKYTKEKTTASVDRIDNDGGYTIDNIHLTHKTANVMRGGLSLKMFYDLCNLVTNPLVHTKACESVYITTKKMSSWTGYGNLSNYYWTQVLRGTNTTKESRNRSRKHVSISTTIEAEWNRFVQQEGYCKLSGLPIFCQPREQQTASLDRIDSSLGYTNTNCQWVHKLINNMKWSMSDDKFKYWCKLVATKHPCHNIDINQFLQDQYIPTQYGVYPYRKPNLWVARATPLGQKTFILGTYKDKILALHVRDWFLIQKGVSGRLNEYLNFPYFDYDNFIPPPMNGGQYNQHIAYLMKEKNHAPETMPTV
jgi:hypothetical protein